MPGDDIKIIKMFLMYNVLMTPIEILMWFKWDFIVNYTS